MTKGLLVVAGLIGVAVGVVALAVPDVLTGSYGVPPLTDASLLSDYRAAGGTVLAFGALIGLGAFVERLRGTALLVGAVVYLAYGLSRLFSMAVDGLPAAGLVVACAVELLVGAACAVLSGRGSGTARALARG